MNALLAGQADALMQAQSGAPLAEVLNTLAQAAEAGCEGKVLVSILLLDDDGKHLRHAAAPSLPDAYNEGIDGVAIGPTVGSCGTAAFLGHSIFVIDIEKDPLWQNYSGLALGHGLRACWSTPFCAKDGSVLGTLALYYRECRSPTEAERDLVKFVASTCSLVVEKARVDAAVKELQERARLVADITRAGYFTWDVDTDKVTWQNDRPYEIFGIPLSEGPINAQRFSAEFLHPDDRQAFVAVLTSAFATGRPFRFEARVRRKATGDWCQIELNGVLEADAFAKGKRRVVGVVADVTDQHSSTQGGPRRPELQANAA